MSEELKDPSKTERQLSIYLDDETWDVIDTECRLVHPKEFAATPDRIRAFHISRTFIHNGVFLHTEMLEEMRSPPSE